MGENYQFADLFLKIQKFRKKITVPGSSGWRTSTLLKKSRAKVFFCSFCEDFQSNVTTSGSFLQKWGMKNIQILSFPIFLIIRYSMKKEIDHVHCDHS